jgi:uncharacterized YccA/Bax inhibitor family protein
MKPTAAARPAPERQTGNPAFDPSRYGAAATRDERQMTVTGAAAKSFLFTLVVVGGAVLGWSLVEPDPGGDVVWPGWTWWVGLSAFAFALIAIFRPQAAAVAGLVYSVLEGTVLGAVSAIYEIRWDGIVSRAVILTIGVLFATLALYALGLLRGSTRLARGVSAAMGGLILLYLFGWILSLFGVDAAFWARPTSFGVFFSVVVVGLAALNLVLDFDMIERLSEGGVPKRMEWFAAFGVVLTLVWLYLEVLRLIALSRQRA